MIKECPCRCARIYLFAALVDDADEPEKVADQRGGPAYREACLALLEHHTCQLWRRAYCARGVKERALLLLQSLLTSAQLPTAGLQMSLLDSL